MRITPEEITPATAMEEAMAAYINAFHAYDEAAAAFPRTTLPEKRDRLARCAELLSSTQHRLALAIYSRRQTRDKMEDQAEVAAESAVERREETPEAQEQGQGTARGEIVAPGAAERLAPAPPPAPDLVALARRLAKELGHVQSMLMSGVSAQPQGNARRRALLAEARKAGLLGDGQGEGGA